MGQVELRNVEKVYYPSELKAVHSTDLEIHDGEFLVLVGPSGCGKSTILRMIAGLEDITHGEILINDEVVNHQEPKQRSVSMVFQDYALYPHMNVYENLSFSLELQNFPEAKVEERVQEAAEILEIEDLLKRKPKQLSGGQRQRVAVGRAIVRRPEVFLFDEPLSNLDAKLRVQMRTELSRIHNKLRSTMIYVTHDQVEALTLGERIAVLNEGKIQQVDTPIELYKNPNNKFVGGFIGTPPMNFLNAWVEKSDETIYIVSDGFEIKAPNRLVDLLDQHGFQEGDDITVGLRPEDIHDYLYAPDRETAEPLDAMVEVVEPMGSELITHLNIGEQEAIAKLSNESTPTTDQEMSVVFDLSNMHLFDPKTEERLKTES